MLRNVSLYFVTLIFSLVFSSTDKNKSIAPDNPTNLFGMDQVVASQNRRGQQNKTLAYARKDSNESSKSSSKSEKLLELQQKSRAELLSNKRDYLMYIYC